MAAPAPPPALMEELIGEILLRLPPDEPACLVRAALVCKPWLRLLCHPGFPRRYRGFHRAPPLLGFFHNTPHNSVPRFVPTARPFSLPDLIWNKCEIVDCRHGRVLLHCYTSACLMVWDPASREQQYLSLPDDRYMDLSAAVLCASDSCDHLDCHGGPFLVVYAVTKPWNEEILARLYSSETGEWSELASIQVTSSSQPKMPRASLLTKDALYFTLHEPNNILKYDLGARSLSLMDPPVQHMVNIVPIMTEDGGLGVAGVEGHKLRIWSWRVCSDGIASWARDRAIKLQTVLPVSSVLKGRNVVLCFIENAGTILISTSDGVFTFEMKSSRIRKVCNFGCFDTVFPFVSFWLPGTQKYTARRSPSGRLVWYSKYW